ncbi:putative MRNA cleavage factor complex component Pcf11 [Taphrina deformans PYCC 5710]|uniref:mRNA cleavage factor complex component Pcf11 n=1 Tax=Taphrina deformans (strain PYCC 5710 / ATCC 11124 / CBS 356.35 / IMI 108563 / JCM 9778 / NBRC 8474) TaxID=1097556 RepID=R4XB14_TAPDE|nr:putative MRNA cleavage factor complex component Pcf11 [Taphrina deformans PYCC 5710]|eukprot:CCG82769.1 putative MRNA cleavage factor complex component Pcf11 [Taphrina deformans PYCC 5710]
MSHGLSAAELEEIRVSYEEELAGLTFNSKPIINMLTTIAQENLNAASVICKTIEDRIRSAPPHQKLPVMYLLDSISKNVGSPFTPIFGRNLYKTYMDCYTAVDNNTRRSLESLFSTWKLPVAGSNSPVPVYPVEDTRRIDDALLRIRAVQDRNPGYLSYSQTPIPYNSPSPFPQQHLQQYPGQSSARYAEPPQEMYRQPHPAQYGHFPIQPVQMAVRNTAATAIISDIDGLLRTLDARARLNPEDATTLKFITSLRGLHELLSTQNLRPLQLDDIRNSLREVAAFCAQPVRTLHQQNVQPPQHLLGTQNPQMDLFAQLAKAGILPQSGSNTPVSVPAFLQPQANVIYVELSSNAMLQSRPELIDVLYTSMPLQCYQCGRRWKDTPADRILKDEHLDWHFKTNKRLREHSVRTQSRALYLSETEWINFTLATDNAQDQTNPSSNKTVDPSTATIPKPSDPALQDSVCPICKEPFDTDWDDTNEQWVWKNAVDIGGTAFHSTCHAETIAAQKKAASVKSSAKLGSKHENDSNPVEVPTITEEEEDEDIVLPGMHAEPSIKNEEVESDEQPSNLPNSAVIKEEDGPETAIPFKLEDALKSLSGTLSAINGSGQNVAPNGVKRKASEEVEDRRVKVEPEV